MSIFNARYLVSNVIHKLFIDLECREYIFLISIQPNLIPTFNFMRNLQVVLSLRIAPRYLFYIGKQHGKLLLWLFALQSLFKLKVLLGVGRDYSFRGWKGDVMSEVVLCEHVLLNNGLLTN